MQTDPPVFSGPGHTQSGLPAFPVRLEMPGILGLVFIRQLSDQLGSKFF